MAPGGPEFARSLTILAQAYKQLGRLTDAEPVLKRAVSVCEASNGPQHTSLVPVLENYAELLRKNNKSKEADKLLARARAIKGI
jgi:Tfp pilus assembly protein PilF